MATADRADEERREAEIASALDEINHARRRLRAATDRLERLRRDGAQERQRFAAHEADQKRSR